MKIREDFVTNSSSSSYVIAHKKLEVDAETKEKYPELQKHLDLMENILLADYGEVFRTKEEWDAYMIGYHNCYVSYTEKKNTIEAVLENADEQFRELYEKGIAFLEKGYIIFYKTISQEDDFSYGDDLMHDLEKILPQDVVILDEEGY